MVSGEYLVFCVIYAYVLQCNVMSAHPWVSLRCFGVT